MKLKDKVYYKYYQTGITNYFKAQIIEFLYSILLINLDDNNELSQYLPIFKNYDDFHNRFNHPVFECDSNKSIDKIDRDVLYYLAKHHRMHKPFLWKGKINKGLGDLGIFNLCYIDKTYHNAFIRVVANAYTLVHKQKHIQLIKDYYLSLPVQERLKFLKDNGCGWLEGSFYDDMYFNNVEDLKKSKYYNEELFKKFEENYEWVGGGIKVRVHPRKYEALSYHWRNFEKYIEPALKYFESSKRIISTLHKYNLIDLESNHNFGYEIIKNL